MGANPSFQFYPADWLNDIKLQSCEMYAQGVFINLMCLMHQSEKYGYLLINGVKPEARTVQRLLRTHSRTYQEAIRKLVSCGVLKEDENGVLYCQRMVKDQYIRDVRKEAGKKGGNPDLLNQEVNQKTTPSSSSSISSSSSKKKEYQSNSNELRLAQLLRDEILKIQPTNICRNVNIQKWADGMDAVLRIDGRKAQEVADVIRWAMRDGFWQKNILSPAKVRKHFDTIQLQMKTGKDAVVTYERDEEAMKEAMS